MTYKVAYYFELTGLVCNIRARDTASPHLIKLRSGATPVVKPMANRCETSRSNLFTSH